MVVVPQVQPVALVIRVATFQPSARQTALHLRLIPLLQTAPLRPGLVVVELLQPAHPATVLALCQLVVMFSQKFIFLLELGPEIGAVIFEDEFGLVGVKKKSLLQEEHLQLANQVRESILKFWREKKQ